MTINSQNNLKKKKLEDLHHLILILNSNKATVVKQCNIGIRMYKKIDGTEKNPKVDTFYKDN